MMSLLLSYPLCYNPYLFVLYAYHLLLMLIMSYPRFITCEVEVKVIKTYVLNLAS